MSPKSNSKDKEPAQDVPKRTTCGYQIRADLLKECRLIAVEEDRYAYEILEEALAEYIARKRQKRPRE